MLMMPDHVRKISRSLDWLIAIMVFLALFSGLIWAQSWLQINKGSVEAYLFPVVDDWTFRDWKRHEDGTWSFSLYGNKRRPECRFVGSQVIGWRVETPEGGVYPDVAMEWVGDATPGSSRPGGWQKFDKRIRIIADFPAGSTVQAVVLHDCAGDIITTAIGPAVSGQDTPFPEYAPERLDAD